MTYEESDGELAERLARERSARQQLARAQEVGKIGSWEVDFDRNTLTWSDTVFRIFEIDREEFGGTEEAFFELVHPDDRSAFLEARAAWLDSGGPFAYEHRIVTPSGQVKWVVERAEILTDESGAPKFTTGTVQDISGLKALEEEKQKTKGAAAETAEQLRLTLEGMSDAFYLLDGDWRVQFLNSKAEALLQRNSSELLGRVAWDEFPEAAVTIKPQYERAVAEGRLVRFQEYYAPLDKWFEISADPTPQGLAVYFRDITRDRARDEQLKLLEAAASRLNDILLITNAEPLDEPFGPKIVYVNDAFERRTGYSRDEVIGKTPRILQGPNTQRAELDRIGASLKAWQPVRAELINYTKSGEEFWLELDIVPLADEHGWYSHWVAVERDISDRKRAEQELRDSEERLRLVTKAAGTAIREWDMRDGRHRWSDAMYDIFGHSRDSVATVWEDNLHPDDRERVTSAFERLVSGRDRLFRSSYRFRRGDGTWAMVEDSAFALHADDGRVRRVLGSLTDVTEHRHLEDRLRQSQKMEVVGQLTGGVAHDFNNLLAIILGNCELLEAELGSRPDLQALARMSLEAAESGARLNDRLLAFSRKQTLEPAVLDVARVVRGMDGLFRRTLPENIDIEIVCGGGLWRIEADASQIETALLNLALNARDAMPDGGCLTIEVANAVLDDDYVALESDIMPGQYVVITVTDTGRGMPRDMLDRVFEPFFSTKRAGKGTGLGLSMVFGFLKQSGGHVRVYSELGEGTSFKMYFPRSRKELQPTVSRQTDRGVSGGTESVLVVEDNDPVRKYVLEQLRRLGYRTLEASTGSEAVEILRDASTPIDLLFTDVILPGGMGGAEIAEAARTMRPRIAVLFTSGYTENSIVHNGRLDEGVRLLSKPYRFHQLAAKVREALDDKVAHE